MIVCLFLYIKFNTFSDHFLVRLFRKKVAAAKRPSLDLSTDAVSIDLSDTGSQVYLNTNLHNFEIQKLREEIAFMSFVNKKMLIAWRDLSLYQSGSVIETSLSSSSAAAAANPRHPILNQINGHFKFNTLNAVMGVSGSGKTSLLRVLNGQCKTRLSDETAIYLSSHTRISSCFITQEVAGHLIPGLTAKQSLMYASMLKNSAYRKSVDHESIVLKWLQELELLSTVDTKVEHTSGGERKRLAVGLELVAIDMPNLCCLDEITSGLDSHSAETVSVMTNV